MTLTHAIPEEIIARLLVAGSVGIDPATTGNWKVYDSSVDVEDDQAIFVLGMAGTLGERNMGSGQKTQHYGIQVFTRGKEPVAARIKAMQVENFLMESVKQTTVTFDGHSYLIHAVSMTTPLIPLGQEEKNRRFQFSGNFIATITQES